MRSLILGDQLDRNHDRLKSNQRMNFQIKNRERLRNKPDEMEAVRERSRALKSEWLIYPR